MRDQQSYFKMVCHSSTAVEIQPNGTLKALKAGNVLLTVSTTGLQEIPLKQVFF